jgi:hypothetical protein
VVNDLPQVMMLRITRPSNRHGKTAPEITPPALAAETRTNWPIDSLAGKYS